MLINMGPSSNPPSAKFIQVGKIAHTCLASGHHGKVLAAFSKAIYLLTDAGELFWITTADSPMHPRCAIISTPLPQLLVGSPFHMEAQRLTIEPDIIFEAANATLWSTPPLDPKHVLELSELSARIRSFFINLNNSQVEGFGKFIPHLQSISQNSSSEPAPELTNSLLLFAQPYVLDLARACLEHKLSQISKNADALIGLGTGLTPSGDDFLGGFLFAVKTLHIAYPNLGFIDAIIPIEPYRSRTHLISFTLLKDLASGHAIAPLHQIINGLIAGKSFESIYPAISQLTRVGHSTGWDLLTGLLTGLLITHRSANGC